MPKSRAGLFEDFLQGISANAFGTSAAAEKPFPMTDSLPLWYDLFVIKTSLAFDKINIQNITDKAQLQELLPTVSNLRFILYKMMRSRVGLTEEQKSASLKAYQTVFNFLLNAIHIIVPEDSYCHHSNLLFTPKEIDQKLSSLVLKTVEDTEESRLIAKLNLGLMSLVHGIYNDIVTDFGVDVYGPYEVILSGTPYTLLIKHFPFLNPSDLNWPAEFLLNHKEVYLYNFYQNIQWEIKGVGCHTNILSGNPIDGLKKYTVIADNQTLNTSQIETLTTDSLKKSQDLYLTIIDSGFEEQKKQAIYQEYFQFQNVFQKAGLDWHPTQAQLDRVKNIPILPTPDIINNMDDYRQFLDLDSFEHDILL